MHTSSNGSGEFTERTCSCAEIFARRLWRRSMPSFGPRALAGAGFVLGSRIAVVVDITFASPQKNLSFVGHPKIAGWFPSLKQIYRETHPREIVRWLQIPDFLPGGHEP